MAHDQRLRRAFTDEVTVVAWFKRGGRYKYRPVMGWPFRTAKKGRNVTRTDMLRAQRVREATDKEGGPMFLAYLTYLERWDWPACPPMRPLP